MTRLTMMFVALVTVTTNACVWAPVGGYQGGPLSHQVAHMPSTGLQPYRPRVPRVVGFAAILSLACVAPNGWDTLPTPTALPVSAPGVPREKPSIESKSSASGGGIGTERGLDIDPCTKPLAKPQKPTRNR